VRALEQEGEVVGAALLEMLRPEVGYVFYIFVASAARRSGGGGQLLDDALVWFRARKAWVVYAAAEEKNRASIALFRSRGFREVQKKERNWEEGGLGAWGLRSRMHVLSGEVLLGLDLRSAGVGTPASTGGPAPR
jgi:L-amino acid N-acyltransferase YncA